jgi:hypothetical protein
MFVLDASDVGGTSAESYDAELIVQSIKKKWGREHLTITRRGRNIRIVTPHPTTLSAIHGFILLSPRTGESARLHTYRRKDPAFLKVNWRPKVEDAVA